MIFVSRPPRLAVGALLAHTFRLGTKVVPKGAPLSAASAEALAEAGHAEIAVAILEDGDVGENEAAARVAGALAVPGLSCTTAAAGRCNLVADRDGLVTVARAPLQALNAISEDITVATVAAETTVRAGDRVATVKIIPFAASGAAVACCVAQAGASAPLRMAPFRRKRAWLVATVQDGRPNAPTEALRARLAAHAVELVAVESCNHDSAAVADWLRRAQAAQPDLMLVLGASATSDRRDVIPSAVVAAGGVVARLGMPADPGNLLVLARLGATPVVAIPGCARAPKDNGFDLVLRRIAADLPVGADDIADMALGGLLG